MMGGDFERDGFALAAGVLTEVQCAQVAGYVRLADPAKGGTRRLLAEPWCADVATGLRAHPALATCIPSDLVAIQCNFFEKSAERNWLVPIHQDLSIPVAARVAEPTLRGWSEKEGALFVRAPDDVLRQLVAVRLHLDDCAEEDGPLRVVPGSHLNGVMTDADAIVAREAGLEVRCTARVGDVLVMRPLLLHASSKGSGGGRRRVLHFVFGPRRLPYGLEWAVAV